MKIIFLDMDGVLNNILTKELDFNKELYSNDNEKYNMNHYGINYNLVKNLKLILNKTGAKIVFSTSWRYFKDHPIVGNDWRKSLSEMLCVSQDIFIGDTPDISHCGGWESGFTRRRGLEIKYWIENNDKIAVPGNFKYCVIDDEISDMIGIIPENNIVHTDMRYGLTKYDAFKAINILNN